VHDKAIKREAILPLIHIIRIGPVARGEFSQMTGLAERSARSLLSRLLADKLLVTDSAYGSVRFGLSLDSLHLLFPNNYPEANLPLE